ncbi:MAG: hypothetical protein ACFFBD_12915, partial [Candidatus Hodarchaeota archaeon]
MTSKALKELFEVGKIQELLEHLSEKEVQGEFTTFTEDEQIECLFYKSRALEQLGRFEEALEIATSARESISPNQPNLNLALMTAQLYALWRLGRLDEATKIVAKVNA